MVLLCHLYLRGSCFLLAQVKVQAAWETGRWSLAATGEAFELGISALKPAPTFSQRL